MVNSQFKRAEQLKTDILKDIDMLNNIENDLNNTLKNSNIPDADKQKIIQKLQSVSDMKFNQYSILDQINNYLQSTLINSRNTLTDQEYAFQIIKDEKTQLTNKLKLIEEDKYNKYRQVEINTYYSQKYSEHNKLILWIIATLAIITFIVFLNKKNIISYTIYFWLLLCTTIVGTILIMYKVINLSIRNNMNYQEHDVNFDTSKYKLPTVRSDNVKDPWTSTSIEVQTCPNV